MMISNLKAHYHSILYYVSINQHNLQIISLTIQILPYFQDIQQSLEFHLPQNICNKLYSILVL